MKLGQGFTPARSSGADGTASIVPSDEPAIIDASGRAGVRAQAIISAPAPSVRIPGKPNARRKSRSGIDKTEVGLAGAAAAQSGGAKLPRHRPSSMGFAQMAWAQDGETVVPPPLMVPQRPMPICAEADPAPDGWLRDISGSLWDANCVAGLEVLREDFDGTSRHKVVAHTLSGPKTLFLRTDGQEA
ncbi:MAG: hypothetical protein ACLQVD_12900, partial [Capsulimonadaceae bacterium]